MIFMVRVERQVARLVVFSPENGSLLNHPTASLRWRLSPPQGVGLVSLLQFILPPGRVVIPAFPLACPFNTAMRTEIPF